jgi:hypothetical protein
MSRLHRNAIATALTSFPEPECALAAAVIAQTVADMRGADCTPREQQDARRFLYSAWCEFLCDGLGMSYYRVRRLARSI